MQLMTPYDNRAKTNDAALGDPLSFKDPIEDSEFYEGWINLDGTWDKECKVTEVGLRYVSTETDKDTRHEGGSASHHMDSPPKPVALSDIEDDIIGALQLDTSPAVLGTPLDEGGVEEGEPTEYNHTPHAIPLIAVRYK